MKSAYSDWAIPSGLTSGVVCANLIGMIHENLSQSIETLSARIIAIRDSL
jgi:hypothetical protein